MSESKHTAGPWIANGTAIEENRSPAHVIGHVSTGSIENEEEVAANANLFAAAPDMLDALKTIENDAGQVPKWLWDHIQSVIKKATGESE